MGCDGFYAVSRLGGAHRSMSLCNRQEHWQDYDHAPVQFEDFFHSSKMEEDPLAAWGVGPDEAASGEAVDIMPPSAPPAPAPAHNQLEREVETGKPTHNPFDRIPTWRPTRTTLCLSASGTTTTARCVYVMLFYCSRLLCCTALLCLPRAVLCAGDPKRERDATQRNHPISLERKRSGFRPDV